MATIVHNGFEGLAYALCCRRNIVNEWMRRGCWAVLVTVVGSCDVDQGPRHLSKSVFSKIEKKKHKFSSIFELNFNENWNSGIFSHFEAVKWPSIAQIRFRLQNTLRSSFKHSFSNRHKSQCWFISKKKKQKKTREFSFSPKNPLISFQYVRMKFQFDKIFLVLHMQRVYSNINKVKIPVFFYT